MRSVPARHVPVLALLLAAAACGGEDTTGPGADVDPPEVTIDSPPDGATFVEGSTVIFEGTAEDGTDGVLGGNALTWESDLDGELGTGADVATDGLSLGAHTVTLTATDDADNTASASIDLTIEENEPPSATIASPPDDTVFGQWAPIDFEGSATDPQSGELTGTSLVWSSDEDGGLGTGGDVTRMDLSVATHTVELVAEDPQGLADTATVSITVEENGRPTATIDAPSDGAAFEEGEEITFEGSGSDPEDGQLTGASLEWSSDIDGTFGTGETVTHDELSSGTHTIVLTATDSRSAPASDSIEIDVEGDPEPSIARPSDESIFDEGDAVALEGSASDPTEGELAGSALEWSSDVDGVLGAGRTLTTSTLSAGPHTITLTATDSDGNTGTASVRLLVEAPGSFDIRLRFLDDFSTSERSVIQDALAPWEAAITGDLDPVFPSGEDANDCGTRTAGVDDLVVVVLLDDIDDEGGVLARAGPCLARLNASGQFTTSISGLVFIDEADRDNPQLEEIVTHEVGHVLGIGIGGLVGWGSNAVQLDTFDPSFTGAAAGSAFDDLGGEAHLSDGVPLANQGAGGTAGAHWREDNLLNELMTGFINPGTNPLSRLSIAVLEDIGYEVDLSEADSYDLPMPQTAIWEVEGDATLSRPASSDVNFGGTGATVLDSAIVAGANNETWTSDPGDERFAGLLRLDAAPSLPPGVTVTDVRLVLAVAGVDSETAGRDIDVVPLTGSWDEASVTWDSRPGFGGAVRTFPHDTTSGVLEIGSEALTELAVNWADGATPNHGLGFRAPDAGSDPTFSVGFRSREGALPTLQPRMEVVAESGTRIREAARLQQGPRIPLGDDVRTGTLYGVGPDGRILRRLELR